MKKADIRQDLMEQLEAKGMTSKFYIDLVNDYIKYYELKESLQKDIKKKGLRYEVVSGNGFSSEKPNESVQNLMKVTATMLKILQDLDLQKPIAIEDSADDYL